MKAYYDGLGRLTQQQTYLSSLSPYSSEYYTYNWLGQVLTDVTPLGHAPSGFQREGTLGIARWVHVLWIYMSAEITAMRHAMRR